MAGLSEIGGLYSADRGGALMSNKLRILIADDDRRLASTLVDILRCKGYEAQAAHSGAEALASIKRDYFDCVLTDIEMPQMDGVELHEAIKELQPGLPVVLMTAYSTDKLVKRGMEAGVVATLAKPLNINLLLSFFSSLHKERPVVVVDDDHEFANMLADVLQARGFKVRQVTDLDDMAKMPGSDGQMVLLDMKLNSTNGLHVLEEVRQRYPRLPVVLVTGYREETVQAVKAAIKINAYTCFYKPVEIGGLLQVLTEVRQRELSRILNQPIQEENGEFRAGCQQ
jgi:DNA-binding NtrC family response regulator